MKISKSHFTPILVFSYFLIYWEIAIIYRLFNGAWPTVLVFILPVLIVVILILNALIVRTIPNFKTMIMSQLIIVIVILGLMNYFFNSN